MSEQDQGTEQGSVLDDLRERAASELLDDDSLSSAGGLAAQFGPVTCPTVLVHDSWTLREGERCRAAWHDLESPHDQTETREVAADAFGSLFAASPKLAEKTADEHRATWWREMMAQPEYQALRNTTALDPAMAEIGAKVLSDQWYSYVTQNPPCENPDPTKAPGSDGEPIKDQVSRMRSALQALKGAAQQCQEAKDISEGFGLGSGSEGGAINMQDLRRRFALVKGNKKLAAIFNLAGRMRTRAQTLQREKLAADRGEIVGIEQTGDIGKLLPQELALVAGAVPELELLALVRVAQRRALGYKASIKVPVAKGPIVVCVDESGSMSGDKIIAAKALALTCVWLARQQKRWCALVGFAGGTEGECLAIPPHVSGPEVDAVLVAWLEHFYGGGTTLDVPIVEMRTTYWPDFLNSGMPRGRTDLIILTDGVVAAPEEMVQAFRAWAKQEQVRTYGILINCPDDTSLKAVCDRTWKTSSLCMGSDAVEGVLSL